MIGRVPATARLRLRLLARRDLRLFRALYCDAEVMRHIGRPLTKATAAPSFDATLNAMRKPGGPRFLVVVERRHRRVVGLCSIRATADRRRPELGMMLLRAARNRGYAKEALAALITTAFGTLPITCVSVQYRLANAGSSRLCESLGFGQPIPGSRRGSCVRLLRRSQWRQRVQLQQPAKGKLMSNIIGFLEQAGRDAALRHASREQLLHAMRLEEIEPAEQAALLKPRASALDGMLGVRETMYCNNQAIEPPKKKKAPAKKKPAKAPPKKKAPAKKPAKKAPAKRKR